MSKVKARQISLLHIARELKCWVKNLTIFLPGNDILNLSFVEWQIKDLSQIPMGPLIFDNLDYWRPSTT